MADPSDWPFVPRAGATAATAPLHPPRLQSLLELNARAQTLGLASGAGRPLRFVPPGGSTLGYEERIYVSGEVETRPDNWHDLFNAWVWFAFPKAKAALNRRHYETLTRLRRCGCRERGRLRDALTQFDECGVIVASSAPDLWQMIRAHRWREAFGVHRAELVASLRFLIFGHASLDALRAPFLGLTGKALCFEVEPGWFARPLAEQFADLDERLAHWALATEEIEPRDFQPLPLLGIPGATADNENPAYYDDERQFRPRRVLSPVAA